MSRFERSADVGVGSWGEPGEHLYGAHACGIEVRARLGLPTLGARFRGQVPRCAHGEGPLGQTWGILTAGDAEVSQPQLRVLRSGGIQQQVGRFHIAVDDALGVDGLKSPEQLVQQHRAESRRQRTEVTDQCGDRSAVGDGHGEQDFVILPRPSGRGQNVGVVQPQGLLAHEPQQRRCIHLPQDFGRAVSALPEVPDAPHHPCAAFSEGVYQFVAPGEDITH